MTPIHLPRAATCYARTRDRMRLCSQILFGVLMMQIVVAVILLLFSPLAGVLLYGAALVLILILHVSFSVAETIVDIADQLAHRP